MIELRSFRARLSLQSRPALQPHRPRGRRPQAVRDRLEARSQAGCPALPDLQRLPAAGQGRGGLQGARSCSRRRRKPRRRRTIPRTWSGASTPSFTIPSRRSRAARRRARAPKSASKTVNSPERLTPSPPACSSSMPMATATRTCWSGRVDGVRLYRGGKDPVEDSGLEAAERRDRGGRGRYG